MLRVTIPFVYCLLYVLVLVRAEIIFTLERCQHDLFGLQDVQGDPTRYKQCGPSGRVWIVPCAPGMTFHPSDKDCKERQQSDGIIARKPVSSTETKNNVKAAAPIEEEFVFSTKKPKRPRGKGKLKKLTTTTEMPIYTTPLTLSAGHQRTIDNYIPSTIQSLAPPSLSTSSVSSRTFSPAFTVPGNRARTTTLLPKTFKNTQTSTYTNLPQSSEVTLQPEYTVKYKGSKMSEMDLLERLMKLVDNKKKSSISPFSQSELEIIEQRQQALRQQHTMEENIRSYEKSRESEKEKNMEAAFLKERHRAEMEKLEKERLIKELESERQRQKEKLRQLQMEEEQRRQQLELEAERRLDEEIRKRQEEERRRMEIEKLKMEEEQLRKRLEEEQQRRNAEQLERERNLERQRIEERELREKMEKQRKEEQERLHQLEKQRKEEKERLEQVEKQRQVEQERRQQLEIELARKEAERLEKARSENEKKEKAEKERQENEKMERDRLNREKLEQDHLTREKHERELAAKELQKMEQQRLEMQHLLENEKKFNRLVSTEEMMPERPMFPQATLPRPNQPFYKISNGNDLSPDSNGIIRFTTPSPTQSTLSQPIKQTSSWSTNENSWRPPVAWISSEIDMESERTHGTASARVLSGCIINAGCPFSYEEDTLCLHPNNPSAYLQCSPMYGRRGRWTERFCPDGLIFNQQLGQCEKLNERTFKNTNGMYNPDQRVIIPRLPTEINLINWHGNGIVNDKKIDNNDKNVYETLNNFPKELIPSVMTTTYPTIIPIQPMDYMSNQYSSENSIWTTPSSIHASSMEPAMSDEIDLSIIHPLFPRVQPNFLQRLIAPFTPMRDASHQHTDETTEKRTTVGQVLKPVIKQIALDQTENLIDRLLSDEELKRNEKDILRSEGIH